MGLKVNKSLCQCSRSYINCAKITCPVLRQMCQFSGNWMDWDQEWCKCFGSASWWPRSIGKICRGLKKLFNIICSFFGFALTNCFFFIFTQILDNIILKCTQYFVCTFYKIKINIYKNINHKYSRVQLLLCTILYQHSVNDM